MSLGCCALLPGGSGLVLGRLRGRREMVRGGFARSDVMRDGAWPRKGGRKRVGVWAECWRTRGLGILLNDDVAEHCLPDERGTC